MDIASFLIIWLMNITCFVIGARVGQKVVKQEPIKIIPNPVQAIKEHQEKSEYDKEQEKFKIIAENIDNFDGTGIGQKDIPK